jgi:predicted pyridoxine 5'-phosphate oxidase superfamily flavin-nucleotide-binding protein
MATQERIAAAKAYVDALSTGDKQAASAASAHLADDIAVTVGPREFAGHDDALARITGVWPMTPVYRKTTWPAPQDAGDHVTVDANMAPVGAGPTEVHLKFWFNDADQINKVEQQNVIGQPLVETDKLPDFASQRVNDALANDTPIVVSYVDEDGAPHLSLRGSVQAYSPTQLSIWVRSATTGIAVAVGKNPNVSLLYRDNGSRSTMIFTGKARVDDNADVRKAIFDDSPEVEQNHESWENGAAIIIDLSTVGGATPDGRVRMKV